MKNIQIKQFLFILFYLLHLLEIIIISFNAICSGGREGEGGRGRGRGEGEGEGGEWGGGLYYST